MEISEADIEQVYGKLFKYGLINKNTLVDTTERVYPLLVKAAHDQSLLGFQEVKQKAGTSDHYLPKVLGTINMSLSAKDVPMLSAVVVDDIDRAEDGPALGFYSWPCVPNSVRVHPDESGRPGKDQIDFWEEELEKVNGYWSN